MLMRNWFDHVFERVQFVIISLLLALEVVLVGPSQIEDTQVKGIRWFHGFQKLFLVPF